ncbi:MAG TPA: hypothetical protein VHW23_37745 [Kofleriaceae bacterium]|nr:hypothetical protein [Kofleriaceae bacterium]
MRHTAAGSLGPLKLASNLLQLGETPGIFRWSLVNNLENRSNCDMQARDYVGIEPGLLGDISIIPARLGRRRKLP